jgi:hypothetical protein
MEEALGPKIREKLEKEEDEASNCWCTYAGNGMFEVECIGKKFVVDMEAHTCGCRKWDVTDIPCGHAISVILHQGRDPVEELNEYYDKMMYLVAYDHVIFPVPSAEQWPRGSQPNIEPPKIRAAPGRPRQVREIGVDEPRNSSAIRKWGQKLKCGYCMKLGHNKRSCVARWRQAERRSRTRQYHRDTVGID